MASEQGVQVDLYIYDLTNGMASILSPAILGRQIEGVWHTAVVVYGREFFYGGGGITSCAPGGTQLGAPYQIERLGETFVPFQVFVDYIQGLATSTYSPSSYRLLEHNCNHFSDEVAQFLCGVRVPKHIVSQPDHDLPPPLRQALAALLDNLVPDAGQAAPVYASGVRHSRQQSPSYLTLNDQIEEARCVRGHGAHAHADLHAHRHERRQTRAVASGPDSAGAARRGAWRRCGALLGAILRAAVTLAPVPASPPFYTVQSAELEARRCTLAEKLARKERRREKKRRKHARAEGDGDGDGDGDPPGDDDVMAEAVESVPVVQPATEAPARAGPSQQQQEAEERRADELRRRARDPPILYTDIDGAQEFEKLSKALETATLSEEDRQSLDELQQYLVQGEGSWVLGDDFLAFIGRLLAPESAAAAREGTLRCLAACALRDDVSLLLHQDRRHHALLNYAHCIDTHPPAEQLALALFMCNLFENISSSEWLLYISEWEHNGQPLSNIRATTKVCVHALLSDSTELREYGTALLHNIAAKEVKTVRLSAGRALRDLLPKHAKSKVFDEVCVELAMAVLQLLQWAPAEEHLFRACAALARLAAHSHDVPQLVALVGPDPAAFRGTSPRVDEQIDLIMKKIK